ncbi:Diguanylate cyclase [Pseudomonas sp. PM2]
MNSWVTRQDAGLAAPRHGWRVAAAHGFKTVFGHTEPTRGAEWWGKSALLTFALFESEPPSGRNPKWP